MPQISWSYGYDAVGNLTCLDPAGASPCNPNAPYVQGYNYDAQNRVKGMSGPYRTDGDSYSYDVVGDLLTKNEVGGADNATLSYNNWFPEHAPSSVNGIPYYYDRAGNLVSRGGTTYTYDWADHLSQVSQASGTTQLRYDGDGQLAQKTDSSGMVDYVDDLYKRTAATGQETKRYVLGGKLVATSVGGSVSYRYSDYLHSVVSASNGSWTEYAPYGLPQQSGDTLPTDHQFQGQRDQSSLGLYHMGARWCTTVGPPLERPCAASAPTMPAQTLFAQTPSAPTRPWEPDSWPVSGTC